MNLERENLFACSLIMRGKALLISFCVLFSCMTCFIYAQSAKRPELIRDTDVAEGKESVRDDAVPKEQNPLLAKENIDIGNFYFKRKNYTAAIQRYLDAIEYQPGSVQAHEALARAYEKSDQIAKAIDTCTDFIRKNPDSAQVPKFREKLNKLEKKLQ
jgi:tetratricopeptide (TPR) repeat protein